MNKAIREQIFEKYNGKCAYCGCELKKGWHVDHIVPAFRGSTDTELQRGKIKRGANSIENYNPACVRCNVWKSTMPLEHFRKRIAEQLQSLKRYSGNYRIALDYGLVTESTKPVLFHFEKTRQP